MVSPFEKEFVSFIEKKKKIIFLTLTRFVNQKDFIFPFSAIILIVDI